MLYGGPGCRSNCPVLLRCFPASFKTATSATGGARPQKKRTRKSAEEPVAVKVRRVRPQENAAGVHASPCVPSASGALQRLTASDTVVGNDVWRGTRLRHPLGGVTFIPSSREVFSGAGGQSYPPRSGSAKEASPGAGDARHSAELVGCSPGLDWPQSGRVSAAGRAVCHVPSPVSLGFPVCERESVFLYCRCTCCGVVIEKDEQAAPRGAVALWLARGSPPERCLRAPWSCRT